MARSKQFPFETIVVATDFSEKSSATLRYAQAIACLHAAKLVLVHVIDPIGYAFPKGVPSSVSADQAAREELNRIEGQVRSQGIPAVSGFGEIGVDRSDSLKDDALLSIEKWMHASHSLVAAGQWLVNPRFFEVLPWIDHNFTVH